MLAVWSVVACDTVDHSVGADIKALEAHETGTVGAGTTGEAGGAATPGEDWSQEIVQECAGGPLDGAPSCGYMAHPPFPPGYSLVIVVDQSVKMAEPIGVSAESRWDAVRQGLANLYRDYTSGEGSEVSLVFSGAPEVTSSCNILPSDVFTFPGESAAASIEAAFLTNEPASTERPLAPALETAFPHLAIDPLPTEMLMVLITAGAPDACADADPTAELAAMVASNRTAIAEHEIPTYVIELGSSESLNSVAAAGGTERAVSITGGDVAAQVEQAVRNALDGAFFSELCTFDNPFGDVAVPEGPIQLGPYWEPSEQVPLLDSASACDSSPEGGYYVLDAVKPSFRFCPCTCARIGRLGGAYVVQVPTHVCDD